MELPYDQSKNECVLGIADKKQMFKVYYYYYYYYSANTKKIIGDLHSFPPF